ncbi:MAG TPA: hypothetical protein VIZ61_11730 [Solirubrobacterales bacterium]
MRRGRRREERFDEEVRYLIDTERARQEPRELVLERLRDKDPRYPERVRVEVGTHS